MADITIVEGDLPDTIYVDLFDDDGLPVVPATSCQVEVRVDGLTYSTDCSLIGGNSVTFAPTAGMISTPGTFRTRFLVDTTTYYPSNRSVFTILVRPHTRSRA